MATPKSANARSYALTGLLVASLGALVLGAATSNAQITPPTIPPGADAGVRADAGSRGDGGSRTTDAGAPADGGQTGALAADDVRAWQAAKPGLFARIQAVIEKYDPAGATGPEREITNAANGLKAKIAGAEVPTPLNSFKSAVDSIEARVAAIDDICKTSCSGEGLLCLDVTTGHAFCPGAAIPTTLREGDKLVVNAIDAEGGTLDFDLTIGEVHSQEHLFAAKQPIKEDLRADGGLDAVKYTVRREVDATVSDDASVDSLRVTFSNADKAHSVYSIPINHGRYYLEPGILAAFVPSGKREITTNPVPGTGDQSIVLKEDLHFTPALVLNVFPGGRRRGAVSSFGGKGKCDWARDMFGIQAGLDLDFSKPFDQFYLGGVIEPVTGLSLNAGLAVLQGQFVPENYALNMRLPAGETLTPDTKFMARFYFGVTLTYDVLTTIAASRKAISGIQY